MAILRPFCGACQPPFGSSFSQGKWNTAPVRAVAAGAWNTRFEPCGAWHFQSRMVKRESIGNKPHRIAHRRGRICVRVRLGRTALQVIIKALSCPAMGLFVYGLSAPTLRFSAPAHLVSHGPCFSSAGTKRINLNKTFIHPAPCFCYNNFRKFFREVHSCAGPFSYF